MSVLSWQAVTAQGAPYPLRSDTSPTVAFLDIGILVFREGLECILVLAAITASMTGAKRAHRKPVAAGAGVAFGATLITWFIAVRIVDSLSDNMRALDLQAATGLLSVVVLFVIMNWFFHKIYWGGWIRAHNRRRKALVENGHEIGKQTLHWGLILLGFTSLYREGFEVVLFLQSYNLRLGGGVVLRGALLGLFLSGLVAVLTFVLQQHLPHRKMLITTGILLGVVLEVMVGEQAQEMQLAHWISRTDISWLANVIPTWMGMWFAVFPTYETMVAQVVAAVLVVGSYYAASHMRRGVRADSSELANAIAASSSISQAAVRKNTQGSIVCIMFSAKRSISSNCGLHCSKRRSTPTASNSAMRSAIWPGVPTSPDRNPRLLTEYSSSETCWSSFVPASHCR